MVNKISKVQTILLVILITFLGDIFILSWLPKIILSFSISIGYALDRTDLMTIYIVGSAVRLLGFFFCMVFMIKTNIIKKFNFKITPKHILISWMFIVYIIFNIEYVDIQQNQIPLVIAVIISNLIIGLYEEVLFRGVVLSLLLKKWGETRKQVYLSVVFGSLVFGVFHLSNLWSGSSLVAVLTQVVYTTIMGIAFSALLLRTNNNILWCALMHGLYNMASGFGDITHITSTEITSTVVSIVPYILNMFMFIPLLIYGLLLLRKVNSVSFEGTVEMDHP
ncbi:CPBP family intramembrane glutamic endopeptidase [Oscillospiraceae bacterium PP1C4]